MVLFDTSGPREQVAARALYVSNFDKLQACRILARLKLNKIAVTFDRKMRAISGTHELVARAEIRHFLATL